MRPAHGRDDSTRDGRAYHKVTFLSHIVISEKQERVGTHRRRASLVENASFAAIDAVGTLTLVGNIIVNASRNAFTSPDILRALVSTTHG